VYLPASSGHHHPHIMSGGQAKSFSGATLGGSFVAQPVIEGIATSSSLEGNRGARLEATWAGVRGPDQLSRSWVDVPSAQEVARKSVRQTSSTRTSLSTFSTAATSGTREAVRKSPCASSSSSAGSDAAGEARAIGSTSARPKGQRLSDDGRIVWAGLEHRLDSQDAWSLVQTYRLGSSGDDCRVPLSQARLLDKELVNSVQSAVDGLNSGRITCTEGICIVYSSSSGAYFLLHRADKKDAAEAIVDKAQNGSSSSTVKRGLGMAASVAPVAGGASAGGASAGGVSTTSGGGGSTAQAVRATPVRSPSPEAVTRPKRSYVSPPQLTASTVHQWITAQPQGSWVAPPQAAQQQGSWVAPPAPPVTVHSGGIKQGGSFVAPPQSVQAIAVSGPASWVAPPQATHAAVRVIVSDGAGSWVAAPQPTPQVAASIAGSGGSWVANPGPPPIAAPGAVVAQLPVVTKHEVTPTSQAPAAQVVALTSSSNSPSFVAAPVAAQPERVVSPQRVRRQAGTSARALASPRTTDVSPKSSKVKPDTATKAARKRAQSATNVLRMNSMPSIQGQSIDARTNSKSSNGSTGKTKLPSAEEEVSQDDEEVCSGDANAIDVGEDSQSKVAKATSSRDGTRLVANVAQNGDVAHHSQAASSPVWRPQASSTSKGQHSSQPTTPSGSGQQAGTSGAHARVADKERGGLSSSMIFSPRARKRMLATAPQRPEQQRPAMSPANSRACRFFGSPSASHTGQHPQVISHTPRAAQAVLHDTAGEPSNEAPQSRALASEGAPRQSHKDEVEIGGRSFRLLKVIGRGAFGVVWSAQEHPEASEIAIKAVTSTDNASFASAAFEAELLEMLTAAQSHSSSKPHVPQYITHSTTRTSSGGGTVRLAMSFVPGGTLDKWLYGISDEDHKSVDAAQLVDGHLPGGQQGQWLFDGSCSMVRKLLTQLSCVFAHLASLAFHRDVSSHNVLVDFPGGEQAQRPEFALIDFGLAVRSGSWSREWKNSNLAGDPRYWAPSAWMAFAFGFKYVATHPNTGFQQQYITRMDHFSLGVLGLEVLFALWHVAEAYDGQLPGMLEVRAAWCKFWVNVIHLFQMFHRHGAQEVRQFLSQSREDGISTMVNHLKQLRNALRAAAQNPLLRRAAALLRVLADLIDESGTVAWSEIPGMLAEDLAENASVYDSVEVVTTTPSRHTGALPQAQGAFVQSGQLQQRSSAVLDQQMVMKRADVSHRRIRSTGGTVDQELRRYEPDISQSASREARKQTHSLLGQPAALQMNTPMSPVSGHYVVDNLSKSVSHVSNFTSFT